MKRESDLADDALFAETDSVEGIAFGLHALKILSGKSDEEFREINGRFGKDLRELLDRGEPPTAETWKEIHEVIGRFFEALGRPQAPPYSSNFSGGQDSGRSIKRSPRAS